MCVECVRLYYANRTDEKRKRYAAAARDKYAADPEKRKAYHRRYNAAIRLSATTLTSGPARRTEGEGPAHGDVTEGAGITPVRQVPDAGRRTTARVRRIM